MPIRVALIACTVVRTAFLPELPGSDLLYIWIFRIGHARGQPF